MILANSACPFVFSFQTMPTPREKFQALLKKLFQFDCAELEFHRLRAFS